jgi:hypothetical protein
MLVTPGCFCTERLRAEKRKHLKLHADAPRQGVGADRSRKGRRQAGREEGRFGIRQLSGETRQMPRSTMSRETCVGSRHAQVHNREAIERMTAGNGRWTKSLRRLLDRLAPISNILRPPTVACRAFTKARHHRARAVGDLPNAVAWIALADRAKLITCQGLRTGDAKGLCRGARTGPAD